MSPVSVADVTPGNIMEVVEAPQVKNVEGAVEVPLEQLNEEVVPQSTSLPQVLTVENSRETPLSTLPDGPLVHRPES